MVEIPVEQENTSIVLNRERRDSLNEAEIIQRAVDIWPITSLVGCR